MSDTSIAVAKPAWYDAAVESFKELVEKFKVITSADQLPEARDILNAIADKKKAVVEMLADPKKKAHEAHKAITKLEKDLVEPLDGLDKIIRSALGKFAEEEERKRLAALREAEELARVVEEMGGFDDDDTPAVAVAPAAPKVGISGLSFRNEWKFRVIDASLVPERFKMVNERAVQALVDQQEVRAAETCPGIEVYCEKVPVRR